MKDWETYKYHDAVEEVRDAQILFRKDALLPEPGFDLDRDVRKRNRELDGFVRKIDEAGV